MNISLNQLEQLVKILKRGKWELDGEEILAVASAISFLVKGIQDEKNKPKIPPKEEQLVKIQEKPIKTKKS